MAPNVTAPMKPIPSRPTPTNNRPGQDRGKNEDHVRKLAYSKWVAAGRPDGDGVNYWLEAERELGS